MALLTLAKGIESKMGRLPNTSHLPRPIDIDILFYDNRIFNTPELVIPHSRLTERAFVLIPLAEIAPGFIHPVNGKTIRRLREELHEGTQEVFKWENA